MRVWFVCFLVLEIVLGLPLSTISESALCSSHSPPFPSLQFAVHSLHYSKFCTLQLALSTILKSELCSSHTPQFSSLHSAASHTICHSMHFAAHTLRHSQVYTLQLTLYALCSSHSPPLPALCSSHSPPFPILICPLELTLSAPKSHV